MHCNFLTSLFGLFIFGTAYTAVSHNYFSQPERISRYLINIESCEIKAMDINDFFRFTDLLFLRDGEIVACAYEKNGDGLVAFWSTYFGEKLPMTLINSKSPILHMVADRAGRVLYTIDQQGVVRKWDIKALNGYKSRNKDEIVKVFNQNQSKRCYRINSDIISFEIDNNLNQFIVATKNYVRLFDLSFSPIDTIFSDFRGRISSFAINETKDYIAIGIDNNVTLLNKKLSGWQLVSSDFLTMPSIVTAMSFVKHKYLIAGDDKGWIFTFDLETKLLHKDPKQPFGIKNIDANAEIKYFAFLDKSGTPTFRHYSAPNALQRTQRNEESVLTKPAHFVENIAFGRDGNFFATGSADGQLNLYNGHTSSLITSMILFSDDEWITLSIEKQSYFGSPKGIGHTFIIEKPNIYNSDGTYVNLNNTTRVKENKTAIVEALHQIGNFPPRFEPGQSVNYE